MIAPKQIEQYATALKNVGFSETEVKTEISKLLSQTVATKAANVKAATKKEAVKPQTVVSTESAAQIESEIARKNQARVNNGYKAAYTGKYKVSGKMVYFETMNGTAVPFTWNKDQHLVYNRLPNVNGKQFKKL